MVPGTIFNVWVLQHHPCETLGIIAEALASAGIACHSIRPFAGEPVPRDLEDASGLIVMGGPMGVYETSQYPYLQDEMRLIELTLHAQKPLLGVCLGSQLLAATLGARVAPGRKKEIGWYPVTLTAQARHDRLWAGVEPAFVAFHWHGDVFELPRGAISLASSALTAHQAFRYGEHAYGLLFHLELTEPMIHEMVRSFADELSQATVDGAEIVRQIPTYVRDLHRIGGLVFQRWASLIQGAGKASLPGWSRSQVTIHWRMSDE